MADVTKIAKAEHAPSKTFTMRFCAGCGRNDLHFRLGARHFAGGKLCNGKPYTVTYKRVDAPKAAAEG